MSNRSIYLKDVPLKDAQSAFEGALREAGRWDQQRGESVPLDQALDRITAEPVFAKLSSPHYHAAAMDGYALRSSETVGASDRSPVEIMRENAVPIDTGDPLPGWADAVVPIEIVEVLENGDAILLRAPVHPWSSVRLMGEDMVVTEMILPAGHKVRPVDLGAVAAGGYDQITVRIKPRVAVIPSGTELVQPGTRPRPGEIIEFNSLVLAAQVELWGGDPTRQLPVPDSPDEIRAALELAAQEFDLILLNAGSSAGSEDYSASTVESLGELVVHGVAIRPGHPVILGLVGERQVPIIGVPGYPASAALTGEIFVRPLLRQWLGQPELVESQIDAELTRKVHSSLGDDEYLRVMVGKVGDRFVATPLARGAGVITSLVRADGIVRIPAGTQGYDTGSPVAVQLIRTVEEVEHTILVMGSHDLTLDLISQQLAAYGVRLSSASVGSLGGLIALSRREAHLAGSHLMDPDTGEYNVSYIRKHMPGAPVALVGLVHRWQGLMVPQGNPKGIAGLTDLAREDVRYVNRQRGSGTRILFDYEIEKAYMEKASIDGYEREEYTHLAVAAAIAAGSADCGVGIQAAADALGLDFIPLAREQYDLVIPKDEIENELLAPLFEVLKSDEFGKEVSALIGYEPNRMGEIFLELD